MDQAARAGSLSFRQRGSTRDGSGFGIRRLLLFAGVGQRLTEVAGPDVAASVIQGDDEGLKNARRALAEWARRVATDPNAIAASDVQVLRDGGFDDAQILVMTTFVALCLAFSIVNDALGARPDRQLGAQTPSPVRSALTFGRPLGDENP